MVKDDYTLKSAEKQAILRALRKTRGNRRDAADLLLCGKTTLYRKIDQYKLTREDWESIPISDLPKPEESQDEILSKDGGPGSEDPERSLNSSSDEFPINEVG